MSGSFFGSRNASNSFREDDEDASWASSSASSSLNKPFRPTSRKKADYIPSGYIQQQLALEEARRREEGDVSVSSLPEQDRSLSDSKKGGANVWPTADQVLTQKFSSGQLGYDVPSESPDCATLRRAEMEAEAAAAPSGPTVHFAPETTGSGVSAETVKSPRLYPDLRASMQSLNNHKGMSTVPNSIPGSPITTLKPAFKKDATAEENLRRRSSVRFADVDSARSASSSDGDKDVVDVLTRATTPLGHDTLNSSLGPALGAVGGRQSTSAGWSPLSEAEKLNSRTSAGNKQGTRPNENRPNTIFPEKEDLLARQHEVALAEQANKERMSRTKKADDEDENKDAPHYLPGYLLDSFSGTKASKVEPFVEEKTDLEWTNTEVQSKARTVLMNEDAPPAETLDTLARKEGLYTRSIPTFSSAQSYLQDTRMDDVQMDEAPALLSQSIIIYGFTPEASSFMLNHFRSFGAVQFYKTGYHVVKGSSVNWMKIRYQDQSGVKRAMANHLKTVGGFRIGVSLCSSFDTYVERHGPTFGATEGDEAQDCTAEERLSVEVGLDAINALQRSEGYTGQGQQGPSPSFGSSQLRPAPTIHHPQPLDASRSGWAPHQSQFRQSSGHSHFAQSTSSSSFRQDEDDELRSILGHSITSGGPLLGGGEYQRSMSADGFLRSTNAAHHSSSTRHADSAGGAAAGDHSIFGGVSGGGGASRTSSPADSGVSLRMQTDSPTGFAPLFGRSSSSASSSSAAMTRSLAVATSPTMTPSSTAPAEQSLSPSGSMSSAFGQSVQTYSAEPLMRRTYNQSMLGPSSSLPLPLRTSVLSRSHSTGSAGVVRPGEDLQNLHTQKRARLSSSSSRATNFTASSSNSGAMSPPPVASPSIFGGSIGAGSGVRSPSFRMPQERAKFLAAGDAEDRRQDQLRQQQQQQQHQQQNNNGGVWGSIVDMAKRNLFWG
ncbi:hypothetical protein DFQ26_006374 [Actinomortierella ambigua]|nr:hypothetical protein DFQ26_006374 [Actinomortierella ambigua]